MEKSTVVWIIIGFAVLLVIGAISNKRKAARQAEEKRQRRERLMSKYGNQSVADDILNGLIRQGMTTEMVLDAWGQPAAVDRKVYRTKVKEVLKYGPLPRRTFANKVNLEDGIVVGWEGKNGIL